MTQASSTRRYFAAILTVAAVSAASMQITRAEDPPATDAPPAATQPSNHQNQDEPEPDSAKLHVGPRFKARSLVHDFGNAWAGPLKNTTFRFKNTGDETLKLLRVKSTCGCTALGNYSREVAPGESGEIPLVIKTVGKEGKFTKFIVVETNDPKNAQFNITVTGMVDGLVTFEPLHSTQLKDVTPGQEINRDITVVSKLKDRMEFKLEPVGAPPATPIEATLTAVDPGRTWTLHIEGHADSKPGMKRIEYKLVPADKDIPAREFTIDMFVRPVIRATPERLVFRVSPASPITGRLVVAAVEPFEISKVVSTDPLLELKEPVRTSDQTYSIDVICPSNHVPPVNAAIEISTNHPKQSVLTVNVTGVRVATPRMQRPQRTVPQTDGGKTGGKNTPKMKNRGGNGRKPTAP